MSKKKKSSFNDIIRSAEPTLVDFYATWCGPCKAMMPVLKDVSKKVSGKAKVIKIDIDKNQKLANKLNIKSVPTLVIYKEGKIVWRQAGGMSAQQLESKLSKFM